MLSTVELIQQCAAIPSFSSLEDKLHPFIERVVSGVAHASVRKIADNNLIIFASGNPEYRPLALTAHLDKNNHYGNDYPEQLACEINEEEIVGQLDDAVGVGICLSVLLKHSPSDHPPLVILFSEMEESMGLKRHPHLLRNGGTGLHPRIGAERIARSLIASNTMPSAVITIDTTAYFKGSRGVALYSKHWERNGLVPSPGLVSATEQLCNVLRAIDPDILDYNNTNDYLTYGFELNSQNRFGPVPSIAIEPAIFPYHTIGERVFVRDVDRVERILMQFLAASVSELSWTLV